MIRISDNLVLKSISLDDVSNIFDTINTERVFLRKWLPFVDMTLKRSDTFTYVQGVIEKNAIQYSIYEDDIFLGLIGFVSYDLLNKKAEIGYWLSEKAQGRGIMINSVKALCTFAFTELELNRIQIKVAIENSKSRVIPEKLGFSFEGIERDGELLVDNKFTDIAVYSILKKEFIPQCK